jgi:hypothetical protein
MSSMATVTVHRDTILIDRDTILIDFDWKDRETFDAIPIEEDEWDYPDPELGREITKRSLNGDTLIIFRIYEPKKRHARDRQPEGTV